MDENEKGLDNGLPPKEEEGDDESDTHDPFGYEKPKDVTPPPAEVVPPATEEKRKKATGYGEPEEVVPPAEVVPPVEKTPEELTAEEKAEKELVEAVKDLSDNYNKEEIKKFAKEHKLTVDQVKAYVKLQKGQDAAFLVAEQTRVKAQRSTWNNELKTDAEFGGANFDTNLDKVEKLMEKFMPDTKKVLTEKGGMLPPYFMKDFLRLAKAMNPTSKFVGGNAPAPKEEEKSFLEDLYQ